MTIKYNRDINKYPIDIKSWNVDEGYNLRDGRNIVLIKDNRFIKIETYSREYINDIFIETISERLKLN